jgi:hypothetical protein
VAPFGNQKRFWRDPERGTGVYIISSLAHGEEERRIPSCELPMNKKRKILTLAALALFGAIVVWHYTGWKVIKYQSPWEKVAEIREDNIPGERQQGSEVTIVAAVLSDTEQPMVRVKIKNPGRGWYIDDVPALKDVRMPLFVLAVFYAGFFFILGETGANRTN